jgi:hypothetical protein
MGVKTLRLLTVDHNPCTKITGYRQFIVSNMANLWSLDGTIVMDFERQQYLDLDLRPERMTLKRFIPGEYFF